jgi:hypothetical protein
MPRHRDLFHVMILEENSEWRDALAEMYAAILGHRGDILTVTHDTTAERTLRRHPVDLLSLDLNLSHGQRQHATEPLKCDSGRLQLIELAARKQWARAVVLITRADAGDEDRFVLCDQDKLNEATVSPHEFLRRRFSDRGLVLNTPPHWNLATTLTHFEELIRRRLPDLARTGYTLRFGGTAHDPRVSIEADRRQVTALEGTDALLLASLVIVERGGEFLSDRSVLEIYRGRTDAEAPDPAQVTRLAQREIDGLRRRLQRRGVNDRALFQRIRKSDSAASANHTGAWRIEPSVLTEGMSTINIRARGGTDFRPEAPSPDDE